MDSYYFILSEVMFFGALLDHIYIYMTYTNYLGVDVNGRQLIYLEINPIEITLSGIAMLLVCFWIMGRINSCML